MTMNPTERTATGHGGPQPRADRAEDLKDTGIRVNVLSPGATASELFKEALGEEGQKLTVR
jgi:NADP-dependent 3-hydroxy acid dehydrogenase YdfG